MSTTRGVVMLDTRFPRPLGDIGNSRTFDFPVRYRTVRGASPRRVVVERNRALLAPFIAAARALADEGVDAVATGCGFLALFQREMAAALATPMWTAGLLLVAEIEAALPSGARVGVVTNDAASPAGAHLHAVGARIAMPVEGLAHDPRFRATLPEDHDALDEDEARRATVAAAGRLLARQRDVVAIVLECTNMPPYAGAVRAATKLPVHDITTLIRSRIGRPTQGAAA